MPSPCHPHPPSHPPLSVWMWDVRCFWSTPRFPLPQGARSMGIAKAPTARWGGSQCPGWECFRRLLVSPIWDEIISVPAVFIGGCYPWITAHCLGTLIPLQDVFCTQPLCKMVFAKSSWKTLFKRPLWHNPFPRTPFAELFLENPFWKHHLQDPPCSPKISGTAMT